MIVPPRGDDAISPNLLPSILSTKDLETKLDPLDEPLDLKVHRTPSSPRQGTPEFRALFQPLPSPKPAEEAKLRLVAPIETTLAKALVLLALTDDLLAEPSPRTLVLSLKHVPAPAQTVRRSTLLLLKQQALLQHQAQVRALAQQHVRNNLDDLLGDLDNLMPSGQYIDNLGGVPRLYRGLHSRPRLTGEPPAGPKGLRKTAKKSSLLGKFIYSRKELDSSASLALHLPGSASSLGSAVTPEAVRMLPSALLLLPTAAAASTSALAPSVSATPSALHKSLSSHMHKKPVAALAKKLSRVKSNYVLNSWEHLHLAHPEWSQHSKQTGPLLPQLLLPQPTPHAASNATSYFSLDTNFDEMGGIVSNAGSAARKSTSSAGQLRAKSTSSSVAATTPPGDINEVLIPGLSEFLRHNSETHEDGGSEGSPAPYEEGVSTPTGSVHDVAARHSTLSQGLPGPASFAMASRPSVGGPKRLVLAANLAHTWQAPESWGVASEDPVDLQRASVTPFGNGVSTPKRGTMFTSGLPSGALSSSSDSEFEALDLDDEESNRVGFVLAPTIQVSRIQPQRASTAGPGGLGRLGRNGRGLTVNPGGPYRAASSIDGESTLTAHLMGGPLTPMAQVSPRTLVFGGSSPHDSRHNSTTSSQGDVVEHMPKISEFSSTQGTPLVPTTSRRSTATSRGDSTSSGGSRLSLAATMTAATTPTALQTPAVFVQGPSPRGSTGGGSPQQQLFNIEIPEASTGHVTTNTKLLSRTGQFIMKVYREDGTFRNLLFPFLQTVAEMMPVLGRKFFIDNIAGYRLLLQVGRLRTVMELNTKPVKVQCLLLLLSGYTQQDNLRLIGHEDLSFLYKFVLQKNNLRQLTPAEEAKLQKDVVHVQMRGMGLQTVPIVLYQHVAEIVLLDVLNNPLFVLPLDFIQSCQKLQLVLYVNNRVLLFPINVLEAQGLTLLYLERNSIKELPPGILRLQNLNHLDLRCNMLSLVPALLSELQHLLYLNLLSNHLRQFPAPVTQLPQLKLLEMAYNLLDNIPDSISSMKHLEKLDLLDNSLSGALPQAFEHLTLLQHLNVSYNILSNIDVLEQLPNLEVLYCSKNRVLKFNDKIDKLRRFTFDRNPITELKFEHTLPQLAVLNLSRSKLVLLPPEFLTKLPNLDKLVLDLNNLLLLPPEVGRCTKLLYLSIHNNSLDRLPEELGQLQHLQYVDAHLNNIQVVPDLVWQLARLYFLNLALNALQQFPRPPLAVSRAQSTVLFQTMASGGLLADQFAPDRRQLEWFGGHPPPGVQGRGRREMSVDGLLPHAKNGGASTPTTGPPKLNPLASLLLVLSLADNVLGDDVFKLVQQLKELKNLNLLYNRFQEVPAGLLRNLKRLNNLYLSGNDLTLLPVDDLRFLVQLKVLHINSNKFTLLPVELGDLKDLQVFDVGLNQLKYNIANWLYDWNWHRNLELRYLNFSGNQRFEIRPSHVTAGPPERLQLQLPLPTPNQPHAPQKLLDDLTVLKRLRVLGLVDVTVTTPAVPDETHDTRVRMTSLEYSKVGYGIADTLGVREYVLTRDLFVERFRGHDDEVLVCIYDGKNANPKLGHKVAKMVLELFVPIFTEELDRLKPHEAVPDAMRRAFLLLNKEVCLLLLQQHEKSSGHSGAAALTPPAHRTSVSALLLAEDMFSGCGITVAFVQGKRLYVANVGDAMAVFARRNGEHVSLTQKHTPTKRAEFKRIRAAGGYVSANGRVDGVAEVSRAVGFMEVIPHVHAGPDISQVEIAYLDEVLIIATKSLWDYLRYEAAVDLIRSVQNEMEAAQILRDHAILYGCSDRVMVIVVLLGKQPDHSTGLLGGLGHGDEPFGVVLRGGRRRNQSQNDGMPKALLLRKLEEEIPPPQGELAIVFTDIKNLTYLWENFPAAMHAAVMTHNHCMRRQLRIVGGYEVKTEGDAFMVLFPTPTSALLWALQVQMRLMAEDWPTEILGSADGAETRDDSGQLIYRGLLVRMGIHWGLPLCDPDMVTGRMDYFGPIVNRAARVQGCADGGQIALLQRFLEVWGELEGAHRGVAGGKLMEEVYGDTVRGEVVDREFVACERLGLVFKLLGPQNLKGLEGVEHITLVYPQLLVARYDRFMILAEQAREALEQMELERQAALQSRSERLLQSASGLLPMAPVVGTPGDEPLEEEVAPALDGELFLSEEVAMMMCTTDALEQVMARVLGQRESGGATVRQLYGQFGGVVNSLLQLPNLALLERFVLRVESAVAMLQLHAAVADRSGQSAEDGAGGVFDTVDRLLALLK